jgi:hypothetical protein
MGFFALPSVSSGQWLMGFAFANKKKIEKKKPIDDHSPSVEPAILS